MRIGTLSDRFYLLLTKQAKQISIAQPLNVLNEYCFYCSAVATARPVHRYLTKVNWALKSGTSAKNRVLCCCQSVGLKERQLLKEKLSDVFFDQLFQKAKHEITNAHM